jgi:hypothetical protein
MNPDFVAQISRVSRPRNVDGPAGDLAARRPEILQAIEVRLGDRPEQRRRRRALQRQRGSSLGNVFDPDVEPRGLPADPPQARVGRRPAKAVFLEARDGAVVDDVSLFVAPGRVDDLPRLQLDGVARDDPIDEPRGVAAGDEVLEQRRDVDQRRGIPNRVVFVLVERLVRARRKIAGPVTIAETLTKREGTIMKWRPDGHAWHYRKFCAESFP